MHLLTYYVANEEKEGKENMEDESEAKKIDPDDTAEQFEVMKQQKDIWEHGIKLYVRY